MSSIPPVFFSGSRLKLIIDGVVVAHAVGFNISVRKTARHFHTLGEYGAVGVGTLMFNGVTGSLQIQKLNPAIALKKPQANNALNASNYAQSEPAQPSTPHINEPSNMSINNSLKNANENLKMMFDPAKILLTSTFEIEVWQSYQSSDGVISDYHVMTITNARLNGNSVNLAFAQLTTETFGFEGAYLKRFGNSKIIESDSLLNATA